MKMITGWLFMFAVRRCADFWFVVPFVQSVYIFF